MENGIICNIINAGEESLTIFVDKRKLSKRAEGSDSSTNSSSVTLETLHQLAASYFIDRDSTLRRLHHIQIASTAIKVRMSLCKNYHLPFFDSSISKMHFYVLAYSMNLNNYFIKIYLQFSCFQLCNIFKMNLYVFQYNFLLAK